MSKWSNYNRIQLSCSICEKVFFIHPSEKGKRKYCSRQCYSLSKRGRPSWNKGLKYAKPKQARINICYICGESFEVSHGNRKYCDKCRFSALTGSERLRQLKFRLNNKERLETKRLNSPPRNPQYKAEYDDEIRFSSNRKKVLERDNYQCQFPDCVKKTNLVVHHKNTNKEDNGINNLITLCRQHHMQLHGILEALKRVIF